MSNSEPPSRGDAVGHGNEDGGDVASSLSPPPQLPHQQNGAATFSKSDGRKLYGRFLRRRPAGFPRESGIIYVLDMSLARSVGVHCLA